MKNTITITYGDQAENHVGMQKLGHFADKGFTIQDLLFAKDKFEKIGCACELIDLNQSIKNNKNNIDKAAILIIRNGVSTLLGVPAIEMYHEQNNLEWDKKAYMYGKVVNKHARHNLCYADYDQQPDYSNKKGTIVSWNKIPLTNKLRLIFPEYFGDKAKNLTAEGNNYYDSKKCGIGYHGDSERKIVIGVRLGNKSPLYYTWFKNNKSITKPIKLVLNGGDIYAMSEKATGNDWKRKNIYTLRHAAGSSKYTTLKK